MNDRQCSVELSAEYLRGTRRFRRTAYSDIRYLKRLQRGEERLHTRGVQTKLDEHEALP